MGNHLSVDGMGKIHLSGTSTLIRAVAHRAFSLRAFRMPAFGLRALATLLVFAGALALAGCYSDEGYQIPSRAMKELSPEMLSLLQQKNMPKDSPILVRVFKEESELEVWKQDTSGRYALLKVYPICRWSGELGPKKVQGDRQAPEGFYSITPGLMNPNSNYYLAINIGFPNAYDRANNYSGAFLMIHGDCSSAGCYAMTDEQIGEIYSLARESFLGGEKEFQIQAYPFRLTAANLARHRTNPNMPFWKMLKEGNDHFEVTHLEPKVDVCERHYVFDAEPPANSAKSLVFNPTGRCPAYEVPDEIAGPALEKQRNDDYQLAQLTKENSPVAPVTLGTDGGMNRAFASKLATTAPFYDNEGHLHAPPVHPGMSEPTLSGPRENPDGSSAAPSLFAMFKSNSTPPAAQSGTPPAPAQVGSAQVGSAQVASAQVASADPNDHSGFFSWFKPKTQAASQPPEAQGTPLVGLKPAPEPRKIETAKTEPQKPDQQKPAPQVADTLKLKPAVATAQSNKPQQEANAAAPATTGSVMKGAQPVVPAGSFDGRWAGLQ
jgi:murein L,D-transpeptidase YafK